MAGKFQPLSKKFWVKVDKRSGDQCWEWLGSKSTIEFNGGYGKMGLMIGFIVRKESWNHV